MAREHVVLICGEFGEPTQVVPNVLTVSMEYARTVDVHLISSVWVDAAVGISTDMVTPFDDQRVQLKFAGRALGERHPKKSRADNDEVSVTIRHRRRQVAACSCRRTSHQCFRRPRRNTPVASVWPTKRDSGDARVGSVSIVPPTWPFITNEHIEVIFDCVGIFAAPGVGHIVRADPYPLINIAREPDREIPRNIATFRNPLPVSTAGIHDFMDVLENPLRQLAGGFYPGSTASRNSFFPWLDLLR